MSTRNGYAHHRYLPNRILPPEIRGWIAHPDAIVSSDDNQRALLAYARRDADAFLQVAALVTRCPCALLVPLYFEMLTARDLFLLDTALAAFPDWLPLLNEGRRAEGYARVAGNLESRSALIQLRAALTLYRCYAQQRMLEVAAAIILASERDNGTNSIRGLAGMLLTPVEQRLVRLLMARLLARDGASAPAATAPRAEPPVRRGARRMQRT